MKRLFLVIPALVLLSNSQAHLSRNTSSQPHPQIIPPVSVTGVMGVFCPREAFNRAK